VVSRRLPTSAARFRVQGLVGFVVDKMKPEQVFSEYFVFSCQSFHRLLHTHPSSGADTMGRHTKRTQFHPTTRNIKKERKTTSVWAMFKLSVKRLMYRPQKHSHSASESWGGGYGSIIELVNKIAPGSNRTAPELCQCAR
jgi:hypothetical protein